MGKSYYSDYAAHCLRYFARFPKPIFKRDIDEKTWLASANALKNYTKEEENLILLVYRERGMLANSVSKIAKEKNIEQGELWHLINDVERKVAIEFGLL